MDIESFDIYTYRLSLNRPLVFRGQSYHEREGILIRLGCGGDSGWGEIAPLPGFSVENREAAVAATRSLRRTLRGYTVPDCVEELSGGFDRWLGAFDLPPSVRTGVENAVLCLLAAQRGEAVANLLTSAPRPSVAVNGLIAGGFENIDNEIVRVREGRYPAVKVKVGRQSISEDVATVHHAFSRLGGSVTIRLDANRAWEFVDAVRFANDINGIPLEYLEEPLADPTRLSDFARITGVPVALDESVVGLAPEQLPVFAGLSAVILRPTVLGGLEKAMRFARRALNAGVTPVVSSAVESAVGVAGLVNLAAAMTKDDVAAGLDTISWFDHQPSQTPLRMINGRISVDTAMAVLRSVDAARLQEVYDE
ncbi:MAG: o-succinylbenzoate synthase [candidate division Zixibacteria bacterium]|jgi:O-succinylbenzoate synthase|nr:o-succinylbenzoate synthase [candidate division Zixibacteria bacterium]